MFSQWREDRDSPEATTLYYRHIEARAGATSPIETYLPNAMKTFRSLREHGFRGDPVPVNRRWKLLDGAHRTSCAFALGIPIIVARIETDHEWPEWGEAWFASHGFAAELPGIMRDFEHLTAGDVNAQAQIPDAQSDRP